MIFFLGPRLTPSEVVVVTVRLLAVRCLVQRRTRCWRDRKWWHTLSPLGTFGAVAALRQWKRKKEKQWRNLKKAAARVTRLPGQWRSDSCRSKFVPCHSFLAQLRCEKGCLPLSWMMSFSFRCMSLQWLSVVSWHVYCFQVFRFVHELWVRRKVKHMKELGKVPA